MKVEVKNTSTKDILHFKNPYAKLIFNLEKCMTKIDYK